MGRQQDDIELRIWKDIAGCSWHETRSYLINARSKIRAQANRPSSRREPFVLQAVRELTDAVDGMIGPGQILICDRDPKWSNAVETF